MFLELCDNGFAEKLNFIIADYPGTICVQHVFGDDLLFLTQRDRGVDTGGTASRGATRHKGKHSP